MKSYCQEIEQLIVEYEELKIVLPYMSKEQKISRIKKIKGRLTAVLINDKNCNSCKSKLDNFIVDFSALLN